MENTTPFSVVYDSFFSKIVDDMYMEMTEQDTYKIVKELLITSIHKFEFPRIDLTNYEDDKIEVDENDEEILIPAHFNCELTQEEINILSTYMIVE